MKIRLAIVDRDENYVKRLVSNFQVNYSDHVETYYFSTYEKFSDFLKDNVIHVVLAGEDIALDEQEIPEGISFAYFVSSQGVEELKGRPAVCRFQKVDLLYRNVLSLFADMESRMVLKAGSGSGRCVVFTSAQGGAGTSAVAAAFALNRAGQGKRVLYVCLDRLQKAGLCFAGEGAMSFSDVIYAIKSGRANLAIKLESAVKRDARGVDFFDSCRNANDMLELNAADIELLMRTIGTISDYQYIVLDMPLDFSDACRTLLSRFASQIVMVGDGSQAGNEKFQRAVEILDIMQQKQKGLFAKCCLLYNRFGSSTGSKLADIPMDTVGGINRIEGAEYGELVKELSAHPVFDRLD